MPNEKICELLIEALQEAGYNNSTIFNYRGVIRRFLSFCTAHEATEYSPAMGRLYANDSISRKTRSFSLNRYHTQGRFIRLLDSYYSNSIFDFSVTTRKKFAPGNEKHQKAYTEYQEYLQRTYENNNTIHFYEYELLYFLKFLEAVQIDDVSQLSAKLLIQYVSEAKPNRQRAILCGLRSFNRFLKRNDLIASIAGIHAMREKRIIPSFTDSELKALTSFLESGALSLRDTSIVLLGLTSGIRACDLVNLKISDIDWHSDTINFCQSKTGNPICLPLIPIVGNAVYRYVTESRPDSDSNHLFVRELAPYNPLAGHSTCYRIVRKALTKAGITKEGRMFGMHLLRHNAASAMVKNEVPIETIAAVLGHSSPDATDVYITTDAAKLRECVLPFGTVSREVNV